MQLACLREIDPAQCVVLAGLLVGRLAGPFIDHSDVHLEVFALHARERLVRNRYTDSQLLSELPHEGLLGILGAFDVTAWQLPRIGIPEAVR